MNQIRYILSVLLITTMVIVGSAQDEPQVYTFESGVQFTMPEEGTLDDSGSLPVITLSDMALIDVVDPAIIGETPDTTVDMPLEQVLDYLLTMVGYEDERSADQTLSMTLLDGREVLAYNFINASDAQQTVFVLRLSDGRVGALNVRSLEPLPQEQVTALSRLLNSFDMPTTEGNAPTMSDAEVELTEGLTREFAYDSGVSFRYPEAYELVNEDNPPVQIGIDGEIMLTMVDPNQVGIPAGEEMEQVIDFAIGSTGITAEDFESFDIGGREAEIGVAPNEQIYQSMVLVRFADETVGIIDVLTLTEPTDEQIETLRSIAASFNSAGTEAGITRADIIEAQAKFKEGMEARDAGDDQTAVDLFTEAIELDPNLSLAYYWRAATLQRNGALEAAIVDYYQALELKPDEAQIRTDIADVYALLGDMDSSVAELERYVEEVGEDAVDEEVLDILDVYRSVGEGEYVEDFYFFRANRLRQYGLFDEALADNQLAIDNDPEDAELQAQRGVIYTNMEDYPSAIDAFTDGLEIELLPILFYNRGYAYSQNVQNEIDSLIKSVHDYQCVILLADDTLTGDQIDFAQRGIDMTIISSDDYEPITDPADCQP